MKVYLHKWVSILTAVALLIACVVSGLVMPAAAAALTPSKLTTTIPAWWVMTGRYRDMCTSEVSYTVTYTDGTTAKVSADALEWSIADTTLATVDTSAAGSVKIVANTNGKAGDTTLTATVVGSTVSCVVPLHIIDGSDYVYFNPSYTLGEELVDNGDFEQGGAYWNNNANIVAGVGKDGGYGYKLLSDQYYKKTFNSILKPNTTYLFSYDYLPGANTEFYVEGNTFSTGRTTYSFKSSVERTWRTHSVVFTTSRTMKLSTNWDLLIKSEKTNTGEPTIIDNISVKEYTSTIATTGVKLSYGEKRLQIGETWTLLAQTVPYGGNLNDMTWKSSDTTVVTVANGVITAVDVGVAEITATTLNGHSATCVVTVVSGKELIENGGFEHQNNTAWKTADGEKAQFCADVGTDGSAALKVYQGQPIVQKVTGVKASTTYSLSGCVNLPVVEEQYLVITVTNGDEVLATSTQYGDMAWKLFSIAFTTPATLASAETRVSFAVFREKAKDEPQDDPVQVPGSSITQGDGVVTDPDTDEDILNSTIDYGYVDDVSLRGNKCMTEGLAIDLTPVELTWTGDNGKGQTKPGSKITFSVAVKNVGTEALPAGQTLTVDIAANTKVIRTLYYEGAIAAGETVTITDVEPWTAVSGDHMISARVNADRHIYETNLKTNQTIQLNLRVAETEYKPTYNGDVVAQAGMDKLTMSDDFDDLSTVDTMAGGAEGYKWYVTRPWGSTTLAPYDYMVKDGVLTLMSENPKYGIAFNSVDMKTNNGFRYKQGYLEVRLRIVRPNKNDAHEEGIPTVWSFTQDKAMENVLSSDDDNTSGNDQHWVELDWLEYWGISSQRKGGYYTTTFHQSTTVSTDPAYSNSNHSVEGLGDAQWHVMGWLWEENSVRCFLDGVEVMNLLFDPDAPTIPNPSLKQPKTYDENGKPATYYGSKTDLGVFSWANEEAAVLYLGGSKDNPHEIDYVRIWQASEPQTVSDNMTLDKIEVAMDEDTRERLTVAVPDGEDAGTLTWKSSDPSVVTIHGNGELYAHGAGKAVVTATNANGISVMCNVTVRHNLISNGDFEFEQQEDLLFKHWTDVVNHQAADIAVDPDDKTNTVLKVTTTSDNLRYSNAAVKRGKTYLLTGKYKGTSTARVHVGYGNGVVSHKVSGTTYTSSSWHNLTSVGTSGEWNIFEVQFTTAAEGVTVSKGFNTNYIVPSFSNNRSEPLYIDDLVLTEVENVEQDSYTVTTGAMTNGSVSLKVNGSTVSSGASVTPGTFVDVTVAPSSGYQLKHGSLTYSYTLPAVNGDKTVTRKALNKNDDEFGAGTGKTFRFVMPAEDVTLSAVFEQITAVTDGFVATLGTSVHLNEETKEISGVRFLNRLYYTAKSDPDNNIVYVMHDGEEKKVAQFGSLLKRASNDGELTLEEYEIHKNDGSATRIWKSESIKHGGIYLVDYTDTYMDFTIVMTSAVVNRYAFLDRGYTVCGYVVLEDGTTIYTEAFTDSVLDARTRGL